MRTLLMRLMGQLGLVVIAVLAACVGGAGVAGAAPTTTSPAPTTPGPTTSGPGAAGTTGVGTLDNILNALAGNSGSAGGGTSNAQTSQMIVVSAPKATDTTATLTAFERGADKSWKPVPGLGPTKAFLGSLGMGEPKDNVYRTPQGTFPLDQAFGRLANPGTKMPYIKVDRQDWWDSNMKSPTYNTHVRQVASPGGDSENLYDSGPVYDYAVNMAHNPQRTPGKASAMFLHVTNGEPTMGCVAIDKEIMRKVLVWLDPSKSPKITIGVNQAQPPADGAAAPSIPSVPAVPTTPEGAGNALGSLLSNGTVTELLKQLTGLLPALLGTR